MNSGPGVTDLCNSWLPGESASLSASLSVLLLASGLQSAGPAAAGPVCRAIPPVPVWTWCWASPRKPPWSLQSAPEPRAAAPAASRGGCRPLDTWLSEALVRTMKEKKRGRKAGFTAWRFLPREFVASCFLVSSCLCSC